MQMIPTSLGGIYRRAWWLGVVMTVMGAVFWSAVIAAWVARG